MNRHGLDLAMRDVLLDLALVSHARTTTWEPSTSGGKPGSRDLTGGDKGASYYAARYGEPFHRCTATCRHRQQPAGTDPERQAVLDEARAELRHLRGHEQRERPTGETSDQRDARIVREGEGFPAREVAIRFRCGVTDVRRARNDAGREPDLGYPTTVEQPLTRSDRRDRVRKLRDSGMSIGAIALRLGIGKATVHEDLAGKKAA